MKFDERSKMNRATGALGIWSSFTGVLVLILPMFFLLQGGFSPNYETSVPPVLEPVIDSVQPAVSLPESPSAATSAISEIVPAKPAVTAAKAGRLILDMNPLRPKEVKAKPVPDARTGCAAGNFAPDFTMKSMKAENVTLSELRGKYVMLNFWATDCGACIVEFPVIRSLWNKYGRNTGDVLVMTVCLDAKADNVKRIEDKYGEKYGPLDFPILLDETSRAGKDYGIMLTPLAFFIDTDGIIRHIKPGRFQSVEEIEVILKTLD
jgi:peroxiredoxin